MKPMLTALTLAGLLFGGAAAPGQDPPITVVGAFTVLWGDPPPGSGGPGRYYFSIADDQRVTWELRLTVAQRQAAGGLWRLNGQRVTVMGRVLSRTPRRLEVLDLRSVQPLPPGASRISGSQAFVWILLRFADNPDTPEQPAWFEPLAWGAPPSVDDLWREVSLGNIDLLGSTVVGWYNLPNPRSYYVYDMSDPPDGHDELDFDRATEDAVDVADDDVDFSQFVGLNLIFNDDLDGAAWGGIRQISADGWPRIVGVTWMPPWGWQKQAILGHEMAHAFMLPHSSGPYGAVYDSQWDILSGAGGTCLHADPTYGCLGQHTISVHKGALGWIPDSRMFVANADPVVSTFTLHDLAVPCPPELRHIAILYRWITAPATYYTVEARRWTGYDENLPGEAVVLHDVDVERDEPAHVVDVDGNGNCNDAAAMWLPGESFVDPANQIIVTVESADEANSVVTVSNAARTLVYVDQGHQGYEDGSLDQPWNTVHEGCGAVLPSGTVWIQPASYPETPRIIKPMTLRNAANSGAVTIGSMSPWPRPMQGDRK